MAQATAAVTVTGTGASPTAPTVTRQGEYYRAELNYTGNTGAVYQSASVNVTGGTAKAGNLFLPPTAETITYDDDGNQTADGRWTYTWDAENRLVKLQSTAGPATTITFTYDWRGRLLQRQEVAASTTTIRYVYDGLQCVAELDGANAVQRTYAWGLDLSGTRTGAGGVGGLLMVKSVPQGNAVYFYGYDGNGNVATLAKSDGTVAARYEYDAYGQILRLSSVAGPAQQIPGIGYENPFRFSTKRTDSTSDLVHYEYRVYNPSNGRWLNRDPIGELGGNNLFAFLDNESVSQVDLFGLIDDSRNTVPAIPIILPLPFFTPDNPKYPGWGRWFERHNNRIEGYDGIPPLLSDDTIRWEPDHGTLEPSALGDVLMGGMAGLWKGGCGCLKGVASSPLKNAEAELGAELASLAKKSQKPAVAIGAVDPITGRAVAAVSHKGYCAERAAADLLGIGDKAVQFTKPVRPRTGELILVCKKCQLRFDISQFPSGTKFEQ